MPNTDPEVDFLYNKLSIPYGRARYIVQVISERQLRELNERSLDQLKIALKKAIAEGTGKSEAKIQITPRAGKILGFVIKQLQESTGHRYVFEQKSSPLPGINTYILSPQEVTPILDAVMKFKS